MSKTTEFVKALKTHLEDSLLDSQVDSVILTHRTVTGAIDAGLIKTDSGQRASKAILIRRTNEEIGDPRAGDRRRLTAVGLFDVVVLVSSGAATGETDLRNEEALAHTIYDLTDLTQDTIETQTTNQLTQAYSVSIRSLADVEDPESKWFGTIITVEAHLLRIQ